MRKILFLTSLLLASCSNNVTSQWDLIENVGGSSLYLNKNGGYEVISPRKKLVEIKYQGKPMNENTWPGNTAKGAELINGVIVIWWVNPNIKDDNLKIIQTKHSQFNGKYIGGRKVNIAIDQEIFKQELVVD